LRTANPNPHLQLLHVDAAAAQADHAVLADIEVIWILIVRT
jgi:hypothetical protein